MQLGGGEKVVARREGACPVWRRDDFSRAEQF